MYVDKVENPREETENFELRKARNYAHAIFDRTWTTKYQRTEAYRWLAQHMGLATRDCHISLFTIAQCREVARLVRVYRPKFEGRDPNQRTFERKRKVLSA